MKTREHILSQNREFLHFLRGRVPVFHLSNVFFRDVHYAVIAYAAANGQRVGYTEAESIARDLAAKLENEKVFVAMDGQTWTVHDPAFKTPSTKPAAPAAPAKPGVAAAAQPA